MTRLSVNLNKVALVRNARDPEGGGRPDIAALGRLCLDAGAAGLTLHPRPDGRHARPADVHALAQLAAESGSEMNVEGNPFEGPQRTGGHAFPGFEALVAEARPAQVTFVPDAPGQTTSDHGWRVAADGRFAEHDRLAGAVARAQALGCRVSLFVDADPAAVRAAAAAGADRVELYTGPFAWAHGRGDTGPLAALAEAGAEAHAVGLGLNAGHDLDLANLGALLRRVPGIAEVSIGQALVADALERGLPAAVRAYLDAIASAAPRG